MKRDAAIDVFEGLVRGLRAEIVRRDPRWPELYPLALPGLDRLRAAQPSRTDLDRGDLDDWYARGRALLAMCDGDGEGDRDCDGNGGGPLGTAIALGLLDAAQAAVGALDLAPAPEDPRSLAEVLRDGYVEHRCADERRCFVARHGTVPVVIVNALGFPVEPWRALLTDRATALRPIVVETRCCGLERGGMRSPAGLETHADDIARALDAAGVERAAVIGWCNGGRVAIDLAARHAARVDALLLLSPTLRGARGAVGTPSAFEDNIQQILASVAATPKIAPVVGQMLRRLLKAPDWQSIGDAPTRERLLLGLPDRALAESLIAPLATAADVLNTVQRNAADEAHPLHASLAALACPVSVVLGDHDSIVSNAETRGALRHAPAARIAQVRGAGHYIHHLQYPYLRHLASQCLVAPERPLASAAARVELELP